MERRNARALLAPHAGADGILDAPTRRQRARGRDQVVGSPRPSDHLGPAPAARPYTARGDEPCADRHVVELIAIPGRFRELLARFEPLETIDDMLRDRRDPTAWTALETMDHVADSLHVWAKWVVAILEGGGDDFPAVRVHAPRAASNVTPTGVVFASLHTAAMDLVRAVSHAEPYLWERPASLGTRSMSVRDVLEDGARETHDHLADVEALLGAAQTRGGPWY